MLCHGRTLSFEQNPEPTLQAMTDHNQVCLRIQCIDVHQASVCAEQAIKRGQGRNLVRDAYGPCCGELRPVSGEEVAALCDAAVIKFVWDCRGV